MAAMSKASEWARREIARTAALEAAKARIEEELDAPSPDAPATYVHRSNVFASVSAFSPDGELIFRNVSHNPHMTATEALDFGRWLIATFGEP